MSLRSLDLAWLAELLAWLRRYVRSLCPFGADAGNRKKSTGRHREQIGAPSDHGPQTGQQ